MLPIIKTLWKAILLVYGLFVIVNVVNAQEIIFEDNFDDGNDIGWFKMTEYGPNVSNNWVVKDGMYGIKITSNSTATNSFIDNQDLTDYLYELDMKIVSGFDKNLIFRYRKKDGDWWWYEVHITGSEAHFHKTGYGYILHKQIDISNGHTYRWRIYLKGPHIKVDYRNVNESEYKNVFDFIDTNNPYLKGAPGLRVGTGNVTINKPAEIYFDNIVVRDLSKPEPTEFVLNTPFFSQIDPVWKDVQYGETNKTIGQWGCAVTSAAMTLIELGFSKGPSGQETTPETLNHYLRTPEVHGYNKWGGVIWSSFIQYAKHSRESGHTSSDTPLPQFSYLPFNNEQVIQGINGLHSRILKVQTGADAYHFVVAKGYTLPTKQLILNDPLTLLNSNPILDTHYPNNSVAKVAQFLPTTDFNGSYLWFFTDEQVELFLKKAGDPLTITESFKDGEITNEALTSPVFKTLFANELESGLYDLVIHSDNPILSSVEMSLFDRQSESQGFDIPFVVSPGFDRIISISYDSQDIEKTTVSLQHTFDSLTKTLTYLKDHKFIDDKAYRHIMNQIEVAQKLSSKNLASARSLIKVLTNYIEKQSQLNPLAKELLLAELNGIRN